MASCPKCGEKIEEDSFFCQNRGTEIDERRILKEGFLSKFERSLYLKIARGFTWFILFIAIDCSWQFYSKKVKMYKTIKPILRRLLIASTAEHVKVR